MDRLAKVREWKERMEERARAARFAVESRAADLAREIEALRMRRLQLPDDPTAAAFDELSAWSRHAEWLRRREDRIQAALDALQAELAAKRAAHLAACQEVESLKRLEERRAKHRKRIRERKMQETIDDAASRRFLPTPGRNFPVSRPDRDSQSRPGTGEPASEAGFPSSAR